MKDEYVAKCDAVASVSADIRSDSGVFYIGDICYALEDRFYHNFWGVVHDYDDGVFTDPVSGHEFSVFSTRVGDGLFYDKSGEYGFSVDAGNIGIVPMEVIMAHPRAEPNLAQSLENLGVVITAPAGTVASFEAQAFGEPHCLTHYDVTVDDDEIEIIIDWDDDGW